MAEKTSPITQMPPAVRHRNQGTAMQVAVKPCWLGWVLVAATTDGICAIALGDDSETLMTQLQQDFPNTKISENIPQFKQWVNQVLVCIEHPERSVNFPLDVHGTPFQQQVWQALQAIPPGITITYTDLAHQLHQPKAVRAVARACASNRIAVIIPCHRVVGRDGALRGYRWGCDRKQALLDREGKVKRLTHE